MAEEIVNLLLYLQFSWQNSQLKRTVINYLTSSFTSANSSLTCVNLVKNVFRIQQITTISKVGQLQKKVHSNLPFEESFPRLEK